MRLERWIGRALAANAEFRKLWAATSISELGSQVTLLALPLTGVLVLHASAAQMGVLTALGLLPYPLLALFAGVWADRRHRRATLVVADLGRAALLAVVPIGDAFGWLRIEELYVIAFLVGTLTVYFDVAFTSYVPDLVAEDELVGANSALMTSVSGAQVAGPGLGGALVQLVTAPVTIAADAASFVLSALFVGGIRSTGFSPPARERGERMWNAIVEGLRFVVRQPFLRAVVLPMSLLNVANFVVVAVFVLFASRQLGISAALIGVIFAVAGAGAVIGSATAAKTSAWLGAGPATLWGAALFGLAPALVPLARGPEALAVAMLAASQLLAGIGLMILDVNLLSVRQHLTPAHLQGRTGATLRLLSWGAKPVGALLGGALGSQIGLRHTLWVAVGIGAIAVVWLAASPLRSLRDYRDLTPVEDGPPMAPHTPLGSDGAERLGAQAAHPREEIET